jgi:hypothetical protein
MQKPVNHIDCHFTKQLRIPNNWYSVFGIFRIFDFEFELLILITYYRLLFMNNIASGIILIGFDYKFFPLLGKVNHGGIG